MGVQPYSERAGVGTGFNSSQAEATPEFTESQDQLIQKVTGHSCLTQCADEYRIDFFFFF